MSAAASAAAAGPPYLPKTASLGGRPVPHLDDPICAVMLALFVVGAAANMTILQINLRRDHKFAFSGMLFGFCMARSTAMVMRIVWASRPTDINVAIASSIFTLAGVVLLFIVNLVFAQRLLRAYRPRIGWHPTARIVFRLLFASVPACLIMLIVASVMSFFTLNTTTLHRIRDIQLVGGTWFAVLAFLPLPLLAATLLAAPRPPHHGAVESFGSGRLLTKVRLLIFTSLLLTLGAGFRLGVNFAPRPAAHPAWYHSKPCYYVFNFVIEIVCLYTYTLCRVDLRFHVPNGASAPGHYSAGHAGTLSGSSSNDKPDSEPLRRKTSLSDRINTESDTFGSDAAPHQKGTAVQDEKAGSESV